MSNPAHLARSWAVTFTRMLLDPTATVRLCESLLAPVSLKLPLEFDGLQGLWLQGPCGLGLASLSPLLLNQGTVPLQFRSLGCEADTALPFLS